MTDRDARNYMNIVKQLMDKEFYANNKYKYNDQYSNINYYLRCNENKKEVIEFKTFIAEYLSKLFYNQDFLKSLEIDNNLYYYKRQEIFKHFIFNSDNCYILDLLCWILPEFNEIGCLYNINYTDVLNDFFKKYIDMSLNDEIIKKINWFIANSPVSISSSIKPNNYGTLEDTITEIRKLNYGIKTTGFNNYKSDMQQDSYFVYNNPDYNYFEAYKNKIVGNYGELVVASEMKKELNFEHTSLLSDNFHYDSYFQSYIDNSIQENVREIKTTQKNIQDDNEYFSLSEYEYNVMLDCIKRDNVNYRLIRFFMDANNPNNDEFYPLYYNVNNNTFNYNNTPIYELTNDNNKKMVYTRIKKS